METLLVVYMVLKELLLTLEDEGCIDDDTEEVWCSNFVVVITLVVKGCVVVTSYCDVVIGSFIDDVTGIFTGDVNRDVEAIDVE